MLAPAPDQIELSLFGPGYGESCLIHIGSGKWIIIDSCIDTVSKQPASLSYLRSIGIDPGSAVVLIVMTHWHDDHIRGLAEVIRECRSAKVCLSAALGRKEFLETVAAFDQRSGIVAGSGVSELARIYEHLRLKGKTATRALPSRQLLRIAAGDLDHGMPCEVWSLSPSDKQYELSIAAIGKLLPTSGTTKHRIADQKPNHLSVVSWVSIGEFAILMGADLEEIGDPLLGWSSIVANDTRPTGRATIFKLPHHGSDTGHHAQTWIDLVAPNPIALLTPWNRGSGLPTPMDVDRISGLSNACYSTGRFVGGRLRKRSSVVEKQIKLAVGRIRAAQPTTGHVRIRNSGLKAVDVWCVELFNGACDILELRTEI